MKEYYEDKKVEDVKYFYYTIKGVYDSTLEYIEKLKEDIEECSKSVKTMKGSSYEKEYKDNLKRLQKLLKENIAEKETLEKIYKFEFKEK